MPRSRRTRPSNKNKSLLKAKNTVRGAFTEKRIVNNEVLGKALRALDKTKIEDFFAWVQRVSTKKHELAPPLGRKDLNQFILHHAPDTGSFEKQVELSIDVLTLNQKAVNNYLRVRKQIELLWLTNREDQALSVAEKFIRDNGYSITLMEACVALHHRLGGLEAQKKFVKEIHSNSPRTVAAFVAHYFAERNEENVAFRNYTKRINKIVSELEFLGENTSYLKYKLLGIEAVQVDRKRAKALLSASASMSLIDLYECLVDVLMQCAVEAIEIDRRVIEDLYLLYGENDWRIGKILSHLQLDFSPLEMRSNEDTDIFLNADFGGALEKSIEVLALSPNDADALISIASCVAVSSLDSQSLALSRAHREILTSLMPVMSKRGNLSGSPSDMSKTAANLSILRIAKAVHSYFSFEWHLGSKGKGATHNPLYFFTEYLNPRHAIFMHRAVAGEMLKECRNRKSESLALSVSFSQFEGQEVVIPNCSGALAYELSALGYLFNNEIEKALEAARMLSLADTQIWLRRAARLEICCLMAKNDFDGAVRRVADYCSSVDDLRFVLPLQEIFSGLRWKRDLFHLKHELALSIALDLHWRTVDETEHDTSRRIAFDEFVRKHGVKKPSELAPFLDEYPRDQIIYFLKRLCVPRVMDVSFDTYESSRSIEEERIRVCALLAEFDPKNETSYNDEIKEIAKALSIQDGLQDFDQSRVHVNVEGLKRWFENELSESFLRYKAYVQADVGFFPPEEFESAMRKYLLGDAEAAKRFMDYPEQEGDDLLIKIYEAAASEYLNNADYGLDAYLSMRVRHGSLSGHFRGPLEHKNLIFSRDAETGKYLTNQYIDKELPFLDQDEKEIVVNAFTEFSASFDELVNEIAKTKLQIKSDEKINGMFFVETMPMVINYIKSKVDENTDIDQFFEFLIESIEILIRQRTLAVREYMTDEVKPRVEAQFDTLRTRLDNGLQPHQYMSINALIAEALPEVQASIDRVAGWFVPRTQQESQIPRTLDQIFEIAIEATKKARKNFDPELEIDLDEFGEHGSTVLSDLIDILFIIFDNVYRHSGVSKPKVKISARRIDTGDPNRMIMRLRVDSEVNKNVVNNENVHRLDRISRIMESGEYRKLANFEEGSGLLKIKRMVSRDDRQSFKFGFVKDHGFFVEIEVIFLLLSIERQRELGL